MNDVLTLAEIERRFNGEWVLLADPDYTAEDEVRSGRVLFHSPDVRLVHRRASELRPPDSEVLFVGEAPRDVAYIL